MAEVTSKVLHNKAGKGWGMCCPLDGEYGLPQHHGVPGCCGDVNGCAACRCRFISVKRGNEKSRKCLALWFQTGEGTARQGDRRAGGPHSRGTAQQGDHSPAQPRPRPAPPRPMRPRAAPALGRAEAGGWLAAAHASRPWGRRRSRRRGVTWAWRGGVWAWRGVAWAWRGRGAAPCPAPPPGPRPPAPPPRARPALGPEPPERAGEGLGAGPVGTR